MQFVIVGTGRCGTGYVSKLLTACGIPTGHESIYGPRGPKKNRGLLGDVSWLAVPYLNGSLKVVHLVREPLAVVRSFASLRFFSEGNKKYRAFAHEHLKGLPADDLAASIEWVIRWNVRCSGPIVRIEDLSHVCEVQRLGNLVGFDISSDTAYRALEAVPTNYNSRKQGSATWADIERAGYGQDLKELTKQYGY